MNGPCHYLQFGLIVTGQAEAQHLPKLFRSVMATGVCAFQVIRFTGQRSPITSETRRLKMVGQGRTIPTKDMTEIGLPARRYLATNGCHFVLLVDDLEHDRREQAQQIFERYRTALDQALTGEQKRRAAVHFLVNMLEAYYFANADAVNSILNLIPPLQDYEGDVESIPHPKGELKQLYPGFREVDDGGRILELLDVPHVLSRSDTCAWLRTLFAWCTLALNRYADQDYIQGLNLPDKFQLKHGIMSDVTKTQLENLTED